MPDYAYYPKASVFLIQNYVFSTTSLILPGYYEFPRYPAANMQSPMRSLRWRSAKGNPTSPWGDLTSSGGIWIGFDFGKAVIPNAVAVIDLAFVKSDGTYFDMNAFMEGFSVSAEAYAYLFGANSSDFTVGYQDMPPVYIVLSNLLPSTLAVPRTQAPQASRVALTYFSKTNDGSTVTAHRYWGLVIQPINEVLSSIATLEVGNIWIGQRWEVPVDMKVKMQSETHSKAGTLDSGAKYFDRRRRGRQVSVITSSASTLSMQPFRNMIESSDGCPVIADVYSFPRPTVGGGDPFSPEKLEGRLYGYLDGRTSWDQRTVTHGRFSFSIEEAIA